VLSSYVDVEICRLTGRHTNRQTDIHHYRYVDTQLVSQTDKHVSRLIERQMNRQTALETDRKMF
jgi:hypothetical protein